LRKKLRKVLKQKRRQVFKQLLIFVVVKKNYIRVQNDLKIRNYVVFIVRDNLSFCEQSNDIFRLLSL